MGSVNGHRPGRRRPEDGRRIVRDGPEELAVRTERTTVRRRRVYTNPAGLQRPL